MTIILPVLAVAIAAFCVWLAVRIVNRRERWAKWTLTLAIGLPLLYVASFGPACWWFTRSSTSKDVILGTGGPYRCAPDYYWPLGWLAKNGPASARTAILGYATIGIEELQLPSDADGHWWIYACRNAE